MLKLFRGMSQRHFPYYFLLSLWCVFNAFLELFEKIAPYLTILYAQFLIALIMLMMLVAVF